MKETTNTQTTDLTKRESRPVCWNQWDVTHDSDVRVGDILDMEQYDSVPNPIPSDWTPKLRHNFLLILEILAPGKYRMKELCVSPVFYENNKKHQEIKDRHLTPENLKLTIE